MTDSSYLTPGTVLKDRYEIRREIGRGGYSVVYLALDRALTTEVALKLLVPPPAVAQVARERMRREVQAVRGLSHANIVAVFDFLEEGPWSFIVMEYVAGPDLSVQVRERGPLDADRATQVGADIAAALTVAHRHGILHRDVKPQNVLLDPDGRARLTDFGSAKLDGQLGVTATGAIAGTLSYTAPELLAGRRPDARSDIYALGLTLYYALTGELPGRPSMHLPPPPSPSGHHPHDVAPGVPTWLDAVIARATAAAPEHRYPTADAFRGVLTTPALDWPPVAVPVPAAGQVAKRAIAPSLYALAVAVLVAGTAAGVVALPLLLWTSPVIAALLLVGAHREVTAPSIAPPAARSALPPAVERRVGAVLAQLPEGVAKELLTSLVQMGGPLGETPQVPELLLAACDAATDLAQLDENLGRFEWGRERLPTLPDGWLDTLAQCERMRDGLVQRLLDALAAVGELVRLHTAGQAGTAGSRLEDVTRELAADTRFQVEATEEVERLLQRVDHGG